MYLRGELPKARSAGSGRNLSRALLQARALLLLTALTATHVGATEPVTQPMTVRTTICQQQRPAPEGEAFSLLALPAHKGRNDSGVLLLVNCSDRKVVSLRDPSRARRHVTELVYEPHMRARLRGDPHHYEFLSFNERMMNTYMDHTTFSKFYPRNGLCKYEGLELTTVDPNNPADVQLMTFDLNICANQVLAMVTPGPKVGG